jgi:hypothetical protein
VIPEQPLTTQSRAGQTPSKVKDFAQALRFVPSLFRDTIAVGLVAATGIAFVSISLQAASCSLSAMDTAAASLFFRPIKMASACCDSILVSVSVTLP